MKDDDQEGGGSADKYTFTYSHIPSLSPTFPFLCTPSYKLLLVCTITKLVKSIHLTPLFYVRATYNSIIILANEQSVNSVLLFNVAFYVCYI